MTTFDRIGHEHGGGNDANVAGDGRVHDARYLRYMCALLASTFCGFSIANTRSVRLACLHLSQFRYL